MLILKKKCQVRFCLFLKKKTNHFFNFQQLTKYISPKLYFLEGRIQILKKKFNLSLNLQVKFREFSDKEIRKNRELAGNLEMGNS